MCARGFDHHPARVTGSQPDARTNAHARPPVPKGSAVMFVLSPSATHVYRSGTAFSARKRVSTNTPPQLFLSWTDPMNNWTAENPYLESAA